MEQLWWEQQRTENLNRKQACGVRTEHSSIVCPQFGLTRSARKFLNRLEITVTILNRFQHRAKVCTFSLFAIDLLAIQSVLQTCGRSDHSVEESGAFLSSQRIPKLYSAEDVNTQKEEPIVTTWFRGTVLGVNHSGFSFPSQSLKSLAMTRLSW